MAAFNVANSVLLNHSASQVKEEPHTYLGTYGLYVVYRLVPSTSAKCSPHGPHLRAL